MNKITVDLYREALLFQPQIWPPNPIGQYKPDKEQPFKLGSNIFCRVCGRDSGLPQILHMVIPPEGLRCKCGAILVYPNPTSWTATWTETRTN